MQSKYKMDVQELSVDVIEKWDANPNQMDPDEFNALCEELDTNGLIDPIQVVGPKDGKYLILGGHHRFDAARVLGWKSISCVVLPPEEWDGEKVEFQNIKMNVLKGKLSQEKMVKWYEEKAKSYSAEVLAKLTGFVNIDAFKSLVGQLKSALKNLDGMSDEFKDKAAETLAEAKNIEDLSRILNTLFAQYGNTLKFSFMIFDYGGNKNLHIKCTKKTWDQMEKIRTACMEQQKDINLAINKMVELSSDEAVSFIAPAEKMDPEDTADPMKKTSAVKKKSTTAKGSKDTKQVDVGAVSG